MRQRWACIRSLSNYESETSFVVIEARVRPFPATIPNASPLFVTYLSPFQSFFQPDSFDSLKKTPVKFEFRVFLS